MNMPEVLDVFHKKPCARYRSKKFLMQIFKRLPILVGVTSIGTLLMVAPDSRPNLGVAPSNELAFSLPIGGSDGLTYFGGRVDMQLNGPNAFDIGPDGTFWISDNEAKRVRRYSPGGKLLDTVDLTVEVVGIADLEVDADSLAVLDLAAVNPGVFIKEFATQQSSTIEFPKELLMRDGVPYISVSGLTRDSAKNLMVEIDGGHRLGQITKALGNKLEFSSVGSLPWNGRTFEARGGTLASGDLSGEIIVNGREIVVEPAPGNFVGTVKILDVGRLGDFWALVDEVGLAGDVAKVTQTVRHYNVAGVLKESATVPISERVVHVNDGVQIGPDGKAYALVPRKTSVDILNLVFTSSNKIPIGHFQPKSLPDGPVSLEDITPINHMTCGDTTHVTDTWNSYHNYVGLLSNANINGSCSGRTKPRYLGGVGYYASIPYDWGGFVTVSGFNSDMIQNRQAGDITSTGVAECSRGVDCSGYVSRVWQHTSKYSTQSLGSVSHAVTSFGALVLWDIFNSPGNHTVMFIGFQENSFAGSESTTTNSYDRVVYRSIPWTYINGYQFRRSNKLLGCYPT